MKRNELTVGAKLYYAKPYEWKNDRLGDRVVVVATEPHHQPKPRWGFRGDGISKVPTGPGVLVDLYRSGAIDPDKPYRTVVPLGHLRGPYAEVKAEVEKRADENRKAVQDRRERIDREVDAARAIVIRAKAAGYEVLLDTSSMYMEMTPETLDRMLTAIEKGNDHADER